jgi:hypothetical protein
MMMAHDSGSPHGQALAPETVDALKVALSTYLRSPGDHSAIREVLRSVAVEARENSILPERLLVTLKHVWNGLPEVRAIRDPMEHTLALQKVVTICIGEYYR